MFLGAGADQKRKCTINAILNIIIVFAVTQIPTALLYVYWLNTGTFLDRYMMDTVLNIVQQALLPTIAMWLFVIHLCRKCPQQTSVVPRKNITTKQYKKHVLLAYTLAGVITTFFIHCVSNICMINIDDILITLIVIACVSSTIELIYARTYKNTVKTTSLTWVWFIGTYLGIFVISLL
jgi:hypothetical protein